ncbi:hypothetical protein ACRQ4B_12235 [Curtobacterium sp. SP.BCo]|uniref:hypothetical protein n=1 Tax=Curtobacterium sp. SP.BCo TaxID=3435229 RepID=UPI003F73C991
METALVTALIAAAAAIVAAVVSWFGAFQSRRAVDRDHAWRRFTWSVERRGHGDEYDISIAVLRELEKLPWWSKRDRALASRALRRRSTPDHPLPPKEDP